MAKYGTNYSYLVTLIIYVKLKFIYFQLRATIRQATEWSKTEDSSPRRIQPKPFKRRQFERALSVLHSGFIRRTVFGEKPKVETERIKSDRKSSVSGSSRTSVSR